MSIGTVKNATVDQGYQYETPTTGFSITISDGVWHLVLVPAGTLATGTITMPETAWDGMIVDIRSSQQVTALTVSPNTGQSIVGAPTRISANGLITAIYNAAAAAWYLQALSSPVITTVTFITGTAQTYTPTPGATRFEVWCTGQGGGGGGSTATDGSSQASGSGGGAGGTAYIVYTAAEMGANATYTVGTAAGAGGSNVGGNGTAGSNSTFDPAGTGATLTGTGGGLGTGLSNTTPAASVRQGGDGGVPTGGSVNISGGDGGPSAIATTGGTTIPIVSGQGGASYWGGGGRAIAVVTGATTAGRAGQAYGSGGSGSVSLNSSGGTVGGNGAVGIIMIKEYIP